MSDTEPLEARIDRANAVPEALYGVARGYVFFAAFWAGLFVMAVEMIGGRTLAPYFGTGIYVWGSVIFVFMLSLSIGYLLGGRMSRGGATIVRLAQVMIAAGLATLPGMFFGDMVLQSLEESGLDPRYAAVVGATALFLLPTTLWGMVSPYSVRLLVSRAEQSGESAGFLYFVSTAGSSVGTLVTSFYLVLWFDTNTVLIGVVFGSILVGALGFGRMLASGTRTREDQFSAQNAQQGRRYETPYTPE